MTSRAPREFRSLPPQFGAEQSSVLVPVDPFKASIAYGLKAIRSSTRLRPDDIETKPPPQIQPWLLPSTWRNPLDSDSTDRHTPNRQHAPSLPRRAGRSISPADIPQANMAYQLSEDQLPSQKPRSSSDSPSLIMQMHSSNSASTDSLSSSALSVVSVDLIPRGCHPAHTTIVPTGSRSHRSCSRSVSTSVVPRILTYGQPASRPTSPIYSPMTPPPPTTPHSSVLVQHEPEYTTKEYLLAFLLDTCPRQIYLHFLLRLPYFYFSRVRRIFEEAEMTMPQLKRGIMEAAAQRQVFPMMSLIEPPSPQYGNLEQTWKSFIDSLLREWKTFNIISVLLLSAILTLLQINSAANDPLTRFSALTSLICALMSLLYGCIYIIRFGTMRKTYKAAEWAQESQRFRTGIFWNVWTLLAMPAIWLAWSIILYIVCIMSFVWRSGTVDDRGGPVLTGAQALAPRIVVSTVLCLGLVYLTLIASTLRRYGEMMDRAWQRRIMGWISDETASYQVPHAILPVPHIYSAYRPPVVVVNSDQHLQSQPQRSVSAKNSSIEVFPGRLPTTQGFDDEKSIHHEEIWHPRSQVSLGRGRSPEVKTSMARNLSLDDTGQALNEKSTSRPNLPSSKITVTRLLGFPLGPSQEPKLSMYSMSIQQWEAFAKDIVTAWDVKDNSAVKARLKHWNQTFFNDRGGQVILGLDSEDKFVVLHFSTTKPLSSSMDYNEFEPPVEMKRGTLIGKRSGPGSLPDRKSPVSEQAVETSKPSPSGLQE